MLSESKYQTANIAQLLSISFPLMMTVFSTTLMLLCDRLILSRYSIEAMNIATLVGNIYAVIQFIGIKIAYIAEVFVGQYNGDKKYYKIPVPVWQMLWFSLGLFIITIPLALYTGKMLLPKEFFSSGDHFYKMLIASSPLLAITASLSSFFVGRGKIKIITFTVLIANVMNILLDLAFILGVKDIIEPMGLNGAAYATILSNVLQVIILLTVFLNNYNHKHYGTRKIVFDKNIFKKCLKLGIPNATGIALDASAWTVMLLVLAHIRTEFLTVHTIALTIFLFFNFLIDGLQKGVTAIAANIIGSGHLHYLNKLIKSSMCLYITIIFILFLPLVTFSSYTIGLFIQDSQSLNYIIDELKITLIYVWVFFIVDGLFWIYTGVLTASGDTKFLMLTYAISILCLLLIPVYIMVEHFNVTPSSLWFIISLYKIVPSILYIYRYKNEKWKSINIM